MPSDAGVNVMPLNATIENDLTAITTQLRQDNQALPWPQRRAAVKSAAEQLALDDNAEPALAILRLLADDPKWEVRKEVADGLMLVGEDEFPRLAARLSHDDNAFVRQAAQRALDRRRRGQESTQRKRRGLDHVQDQYNSIEQIHGSVAAQRSRQMAERLYDILAGATVHDMRNFLGPLKSAVNCLMGHLDAGEFNARLFKKHLIRARRQAEMIERMLEDMRIYSQPTPIERRRERVSDMVQEAHAMVRELFRETGRDAAPVAVYIDVPEHLTIDAARFDMVRTIMNLIKNAYESHAASPDIFDAGVVWVMARPCSVDRIEIVFRDDGMGLSADELADVRRFVPGGASKKTYGSGFGLPTAKRKIEAHGGSLAIDSKENEGTTVTITLPVDAGDMDNEISRFGC